MKKRKQFEDNIRKNRGLIANWLKYAQWEESQKEIQRYATEGGGGRWQTGPDGGFSGASIFICLVCLCVNI